MESAESRYKAEIVEIATAMKEGRLGMVEGSRKLVSLFNAESIFDEKYYDNDPHCLGMRGFDSETMDYPIGKAREGYSSEDLEALDKDIQRYTDECYESLLEDCDAIIRKFSE